MNISPERIDQLRKLAVLLESDVILLVCFGFDMWYEEELFKQQPPDIQSCIDSMFK